MSVQTSIYGATSKGEQVVCYTLDNCNGMSMKVINYGLRITELWVPDSKNQRVDVVLGYDRLSQYELPGPYFGCVVGRCCNRIAGGSFELDGHKYFLAVNNGPNHLHGGNEGFDRKLWQIEQEGRTGLCCHYLSLDGEEGYPGNMAVTVRYELTDENVLRISYEAETDATTLCNLTQHSYFNLAGHDAGNILEHELLIRSESFTPVDLNLIPTGDLAPVAGSAWDFRKATPIGSRLTETGDSPAGYDHNFILKESATSELREAAWLRDPLSDRRITVFTTQPGMQLYTSNFLDGSLVGKGGARYPQYAAVCLETQYYPDSIHHSHFPSTILWPGERYLECCEYHFAW